MSRREHQVVAALAARDGDDRAQPQRRLWVEFEADQGLEVVAEAVVPAAAHWARLEPGKPLSQRLRLVLGDLHDLQPYPALIHRDSCAADQSPLGLFGQYLPLRDLQPPPEDLQQHLTEHGA